MSVIIKRVLITDDIDNKCVKILEENGIGVTKNTALAKDKSALLAEIPKYDGLIVRSGTKVTSDVIQASNLKIIGRAGTGVDNIDCVAATQKGIIVMNTPSGNTLSAAEHTCAMMCAMARHIPQADGSMRAGRWDRKKYMGSELNGKTLAIIGLGRIGKEVAIRMQSFGMTTIGYDPIIPASVSAEFGVKWMEIEKLWPLADYVTVHVPLIAQTKNLINDDVFSKCKKGIKVINVARGGIIQEDAILRALKTGQCSGAALDVFVEEPPTNQELVQHPQVISTPHLGASTVEAQCRVAEEIAQQFVDMVQGKELFGAINAQALTNALSPSSKPWIDLGRGLGSLAQAMSTSIGKASEVKISTMGEGLQNTGLYMQAAVLVGLLSASKNNCINLVNAPVLAKQSGLQVSTEHKESPINQCTVQIEQPGCASYQITGTVQGSTPTVTGINGSMLTTGMSLQGQLLIYNSQADPAVMPTVASALAGCKTVVQSYSSSAQSNGKSWSIMHISEPIQSMDTLKQHVDFVAQVSI